MKAAFNIELAREQVSVLRCNQHGESANLILENNVLTIQTCCEAFNNQVINELKKRFETLAFQPYVKDLPQDE